MHRYGAHISFLIVILCLYVGDAGATDVKAIRFGKFEGATRVVLDINGDLSVRNFFLADPYRMVIDLPGARWTANSPAKPTGLLRGFRHGLFSEDVYRVVLDLEGPITVKNAFELPAQRGNGKRIVFDLVSSGRDAFMKAVSRTRSAQPARESRPAPAIAPSSQRSSGKRMIVVDAGHGGPDGGAQGVRGASEKVITLQIAKRVASALAADGRYEVRLTRNKDIFIDLKERYRIAQRHQADLFISIHADSIPGKPNISGGSIYTLSEKASDREAALLARRENKADLIAGVNLEQTDDEVSGILIELAQRETMNLSAQFAELLLPEMRSRVKMLSNAHRFAGLIVLKAPDVPSVLVETGFVTNRTDSRFLQSRSGQEKIAQAIRKAVDKFFVRMTAMGR